MPTVPQTDDSQRLSGLLLSFPLFARYMHNTASFEMQTPLFVSTLPDAGWSSSLIIIKKVFNRNQKLAHPHAPTLHNTVVNYLDSEEEIPASPII